MGDLLCMWCVTLRTSIERETQRQLLTYCWDLVQRWFDDVQTFTNQLCNVRAGALRSIGLYLHPSASITAYLLWPTSELIFAHTV